MQNPQCGMHWLFDYFSRIGKSFLCYFFQNQASKDDLTQRKFLKTMLLNEKKAILKIKCVEISLYTPNIIFIKHAFTF